MKRSNSYLYVFINSDGGGLLGPDGLTFYRLGAAGAGCVGMTGADGPMASPEQLRTPAEPGYGLYLPWKEVYSRSVPAFLLILCLVSPPEYLNSSYY